MNLNIRALCAQDVECCGKIVYEAFRSIAETHRFPPSFTNEARGRNLVAFFLEHDEWTGLVAEMDGRPVGSLFVDERDAIHGIGPVSVSPECQGRGVGRALMQAALSHCREAPGVRLTQDAFNTASMALYASLGFEIREPVALLKGTIDPSALPERIEVRPLEMNDLEACGRLCLRVHGIERGNELRDAIQGGGALGAWREGRLTGYSSAVVRWGHGLAETDRDMRAIVSEAQRRWPGALTLLVPTRQTAFFQWCLARGLRVIKPVTLMTRGFYQEPRGCCHISETY
ncbi:MAG: GNAT family N-acetyltransferase [Proteobacteria bacterium]|nr:GNAT family N-acetyltransferase [Pseudomonadota bacterium]